MSDAQLGFDWQEPAAARLPRAAALAARLRQLAERNVYLGTSSWKYPGWIGQIYDPTRYQQRQKHSRKRFETECLGEYATVFPTVCGDFSFYQFPSAPFWQRLFAHLPVTYRFSLKVPEDITAERFANLPRYGTRAGQVNGHFMDAARLQKRLLDPLSRHRGQLGVIIFQFGTIHDGPCSRPAEFIARMRDLLAALPTAEYRFAVEVRNPGFLEDPAYFECLADHRIAHCLNSWTHMPTIAQQLAHRAAACAPHAVARFLLRPGRTYRQAVAQFSPYERVQEVYPEGRRTLQQLIEQCLDQGPLFAYVNNRFEGNAIETLEAVI